MSYKFQLLSEVLLLTENGKKFTCQENIRKISEQFHRISDPKCVAEDSEQF